MRLCLLEQPLVLLQSFHLPFLFIWLQLSGFSSELPSDNERFILIIFTHALRAMNTLHS
jgi:hypothetical protein